MESYYKNQLNKEKQNAYHQILTGLTALSPRFPVLRLAGEELDDVFVRLRLDHPEIFYVSGFTFRFYPQASSVEFCPDYLFDKGRIRAHQQAMQARITKLCRPALELDDWAKERFIHDFICRNVRYDKLKKAYSHEIIGPLGQGVGVCEGIAKTVKCLCDYLGLWCITVLSDNAPDQGIKYRHAWNVVRLGGAYYHLDATFDNSLGLDGVVRYDYFNLSDTQIAWDHQPLIYPAPSCQDGGSGYYRREHLALTDAEQVRSRARQAMRKKAPLIFQWRGGGLNRDLMEQLLALLRETAAQRKLYPKVSVNWPQAVIQVTFQPAPSQTEFTAQQANEGETCGNPETGQAEEES